MAVAVLVSLSYEGLSNVTLLGMPQTRYVTEFVGELPKHTWRISKESAVRALEVLHIDREEVERQERVREEKERQVVAPSSSAK